MLGIFLKILIFLNFLLAVNSVRIRSDTCVGFLIEILYRMVSVSIYFTQKNFSPGTEVPWSVVRFFEHSTTGHSEKKAGGHFLNNSW
jgi:hypothetical protein